MLKNPEQKIQHTLNAWRDWHSNKMLLLDDIKPITINIPGIPDQVNLVAPKDVKSRGLGTPLGRASFIHAVAHIEFNAINLAWDAVYRFRHMPSDYYRDWISVAADEARHFQMLQRRLQELGYAYGDFPAHNGLWEMAVKTADNIIARMALVPRVLEARGLDVTPGMIERLRTVGDTESALVLEQILREEVAHVAYGTHWYHWLCAQQGIEPNAHFLNLVAQHAPGSVRGPYNIKDRLDAGFTCIELEALSKIFKDSQEKFSETV